MFDTICLPVPVSNNRKLGFHTALLAWRYVWPRLVTDGWTDGTRPTPYSALAYRMVCHLLVSNLMANWQLSVKFEVMRHPLTSRIVKGGIPHRSQAFITAAL